MSIRLPIVTLTLALALLPPAALAQTPGASGQTAPAQATELQQAIAKSNAFIGLMNRTLRAGESWRRYLSWVKAPSGPTGRERIVYGLYSLYDVRDEIAKARAAAAAAPSHPALDQAMLGYIDAYEALAPIVGEANGYYERKDYLVDKMAKGREIHARLAPAATRYMAARDKLETAMAGFKSDLDAAELADIERREGRTARWQARNVMIAARPILSLLPDESRPVVDLPRFDAALARYAQAVTDFDAFATANPNSFSVFESQPRSYLGKLREFREKLTRAKGDARRARVGHDLTWLVNDYNMMVSTSQSAVRFAR